VVRAVAYRQPSAIEWLDLIERGEVEAAWPTLFYAEVANALLGLMRAHRLAADDARRTFATALSILADAVPVEGLVKAAMDVAAERGLSAYDACYVVLAESLDAPLVTADRRLASATPKAVLIPT
jgi:predicted nucleic acid-binding protein